MLRQIVVLSRLSGVLWYICNNRLQKNYSNLAGIFVKRYYSKRGLISTIMSTSESNVTIGTHDGIFHCDEILACFMLQTLPEFANATIVRSRNEEILNKCKIVVDVGSVFDPETLRFDHHQKTFQHTLSTLRPECGTQWTVRLSSAGLIYTFYGEKVIRQLLKNAGHTDISDECIKNVYSKVYEYFIQEIDGIDNGVPQHPDEPLYRITTNLSSRVGNFNSVWNSKEDYNATEQFERAKKMVGEELNDRVLYYATVWWPARSLVMEAIENRLNTHCSGEIIELSQSCPWKQHFYELEKDNGIENVVKYCIFQNAPNDYRILCVPISANSYLCRKFLPKAWRGIRDAELQAVSEVNDVKFCHATGFIGGATSRAGVLSMAIKAVDSLPEEN